MEGIRKKNRIFFILLLPTIFLVGFYFPKYMASATGDDLIITEIMYDPDGTDTGHEWVELYNPGDNSVEIKSGSCSTTCWRFIDQFKNDLPDATHRHTFSENAIVKPKDFLIVASDKEKFKETYPVFTGNLIKSSFSLSNDGSTLALSKDAGTTYMSRTDYEKSWGGSGNGKTLEKMNFAEGNDKSNWQESYVLGGTPGMESSKKQKYPHDVVISELFPNPGTDEEKNEFVELYNFGSDKIDLENWTLTDKSGDTIYVFPKISIEAGLFLVRYRIDFKFALNNSGGEEVFLRDPNGDSVSHVGYSGTVKENYSYALDDEKYSWTSSPTPGAENIITLPKEAVPITASLSSAEKIYLNEILPNPKGDERTGEFIELKSNEDEPVDLYGFTIRDGTKTGKFVFKEHSILKPDAYLAIYRPQFKIALNNSNESVSLYNPQGKMISSISWDKSSENASYNFAGKTWKWSKFLTPGKENRFDSPPKITLKKTKRAYKNLYAEFSAKAKDKETKKLKYIWDFGDGHKSYLKKTSHRYLKTGKYAVTLTVKDESQSVEKTFPLTVQKYPRPKIEITKAVPNPKGLDSLGETISLKNFSGKKVNLLNYKIATGTAKLANHPIYTDIILKPGEERTITRADSKITLNNKAGKIALLYPDGKAADEIAYAKDKIADDDAYAKINGEWQWIAANNPDENKSEEENISVNGPDAETSGQPIVLGATDENRPPASALTQTIFSPEDMFIFLSQIGFANPHPDEMNYCPLVDPASLFAYLLASAF